jgi:hypothetical protein
MSGARECLARPSRLAHLLAVTLAFLAVTALPPTAQSATKIAQRAPEMSRPHVYLMRGLLNIFSLGMDQLASEIQSHGIEASVYNHTLADSVVAGIVAKYRAGDHGPYILVGHSLGADAVMTMAQSLNAQGVPVALVVPFDGTGSYAAPKNVACVLNLTQRVYAYMRAGSGFRGKLQNVDVSSDPGIDHFTIDKSPRLQAMALNTVLQTAHAETCKPGTNAPVVARPKKAPVPQFAAPNETPKTAPGDAPKQTSVEAPEKTASPAPRGIEG